MIGRRRAYRGSHEQVEREHKPGLPNQIMEDVEKAKEPPETVDESSQDQTPHEPAEKDSSGGGLEVVLPVMVSVETDFFLRIETSLSRLAAR